MEEGVKNINVNSLGVGDLERLLDGFPWYAHARQILLYKLAQMGEECFNQKFRDYAAFLHSRETVYFKTRDILNGKIEIDLSETNFISDAGVVQRQRKAEALSLPKKEEEIAVAKSNIAGRRDIKDDRIGSLHMIVNKSNSVFPEEPKPLVVNIEMQPEVNLEEQSQRSIKEPGKTEEPEGRVELMEHIELTERAEPEEFVVLTECVDSLELVDEGIELDEAENMQAAVPSDAELISVEGDIAIEQQAIDFDELKNEQYNGAPEKPRIYILGGDYFSREDFEQLKEEEKPEISYTDQEPIMSTEDFESPEFCTETLAKIYAEQGYYEQAIDVYAKLILLYPEKSTYFATLVNEIKLKN